VNKATAPADFDLGEIKAKQAQKHLDCRKSNKPSPVQNSSTSKQKMRQTDKKLA
jgi:hypothetical protein